MKPIILEICHDLESSNRIYDRYKKGHQRELDGATSRTVERTSFSRTGHTSKYEREYGSTDEIFLKIKNVLTHPGGLVAIPTETVYGLAGNIYIEKSLKRIFEIKNRPFNDPLIVHVDSFTSALEDLYDVNMFESFLMLYLANRFTPGPLTIVARCKGNVSGLLTNNTGYLATRCPDNEICRALLKYLNIPLAAPSANKFGHISPTCAEHVYDEFSDEELHILDGGQCKIGIESTVIKITTIDEPEIICMDQRYTFSGKKEHVVKSVYRDCRDAIVDMYGELNKIIVNNRGRMTSRDLFRPKEKMEKLSATDSHRHCGRKNGLGKELIYSPENGYGREDRFHKEDRYRKDRMYEKEQRYIQELMYGNELIHGRHDRYVKERLYEKERRHRQELAYTPENRYSREDRYIRERMYDQERRSLQELICGTEDRYRQKLTHNRDYDLNRYCGVSQEGGSTSFYKRSAMTGSGGCSNSSVTVGFTQSGGSTCVYYGGYTVDSILNPSNDASTNVSRRNSTSESEYSTDSGSKKGHKYKHKKGFSSSDFTTNETDEHYASSRKAVVGYVNGRIDLFDLLGQYQNVKFKVEILRKGAVTYEHLRYALSGFENVKVCEYELKEEKDAEIDTSKEEKADLEGVLEEEKVEILEKINNYKLWEKGFEGLSNGNVTFSGLRSIIAALGKLKALRAMSTVKKVPVDLASDDNNDDDYVSVNDFDDMISVDHSGSNDDDYMSVDDVDSSITGVIDNISGGFQKDNKGSPIPNGIADTMVTGVSNGVGIPNITTNTTANVNGKDAYKGTDGDPKSVPSATSADNSARSYASSNNNTSVGTSNRRRHNYNDTGKDRDIIIADSSGKNNICSDGLGKGCVDHRYNEDGGHEHRISGEEDVRFEAPGMSLTHYAPNVPTYLVVVRKEDTTLNGSNGDEVRGNKDWTEHMVGRVSNFTNNRGELKKVDCRNIVMIDIGYRFKSHSNMFKEYLPIINEPTSVANQLYSILRRAESAAQPSVEDNSDTQAIIAIYFNERKIQLYSAIHDRITRSTSGNPIYAQINDQELEFLVK